MPVVDLDSPQQGGVVDLDSPPEKDLAREANRPALAPKKSIGSGASSIIDTAGRLGVNAAKGFLEAIVDVGGSVGKSFVATQAATERIGKSMGADIPTPFAGAADTIGKAQAWLNEKIEENLPKADDITWSVPIVGDIGVGKFIGGAAPFALAGAKGFAGLVPESMALGTGTVAKVTHAMLEAGVFTTATEIPNILSSKDWKEATDRAKQAGVSIPFNAVLGGAFAGAGEGLSFVKGRFKSERQARAEAKAASEAGVPKTMDLGANEPKVSPVDEVEANRFEEAAKRAEDRMGDVDKLYKGSIEAMDEAKLKERRVTEADPVMDEKLDSLVAKDVENIRAQGNSIFEKSKQFLEEFRRQVSPFRSVTFEEGSVFREYAGNMEALRSAQIPMFDKMIREAIPDAPTRKYVGLLMDSADKDSLIERPIFKDPRVVRTVIEMRKFYDTWARMAVDAGVFSPEQFRDHFINRIYAPKEAERVRDFMAKSRPIDATNPHSMSRIFEDIESAVKAGFKPMTLDIAHLSAAYGESMGKTIYGMKLADAVVKGMPDRVAWSKRPIPGMKPLSDRIKIATARDGGRLYADPDIHQLLSAVVDPSAFRSNAVVDSILKTNQGFKHIQLALDFYHLVQIVQRAGLGHQVFDWRKGLAMLDPRDPRFAMVKELMKQGLTIGPPSDWADRKLMGNVDKSLSEKLQSMIPGVQQFQKALWGEINPGLKTAVAMAEAQRLLNTKGYLEKYGEQKLYKAAADHANNLFGGGTKLGRTRSFNDFLSLAVYAPDWLESNLRLAVSAAHPGARMMTSNSSAGPQGVIARRFWTNYLTSIAGICVTANAIMQKADPSLQNHPETSGYKRFINIALPIRDDSGHPLILGMGGPLRYVMGFLDDAGQFMSNRKGALLRVANDFFTQRDWRERRIAPAMLSKENFIHLGANLVPIPLMFQLAEIEFSSAGTQVLGRQIDVAKAIARNMGFHATTGYPYQMQRELEYLEDRKKTTQSKMALLYDFGRQDMARDYAKKHNDEVDAFVERLSKTYRGNEILERMQRKRSLYYIR